MGRQGEEKWTDRLASQHRQRASTTPGKPTGPAAKLYVDIRLTPRRPSSWTAVTPPALRPAAD